MNILKKYDRIPSPYSTIIALGFVAILGLFFIYWSRETRSLGIGIGIVLGGFISIAMKAAAEASDREAWQRVRRLFGSKPRDSSK